MKRRLLVATFAVLLAGRAADAAPAGAVSQSRLRACRSAPHR